jgi:hypothetical protein
MAWAAEAGVNCRAKEGKHGLNKPDKIAGG